MSLSVGHELSANHCNCSARGHIRGRPQIYETPAIDGIVLESLGDFEGAYVLFAGARPDSEEGHRGRFARHQRNSLSLGRRHVRSDFSVRILKGRGMLDPSGHCFRQNSSDLQRLLHTPLSAQLQLAPLLSFEIASPLAHNPSPHDAAPSAKIRTLTTVSVIFFQFLLRLPQLR